MAWREPTVRLAIARKIPIEQMENANKTRGLKMPTLEQELFFMVYLLCGTSRVFDLCLGDCVGWSLRPFTAVLSRIWLEVMRKDRKILKVKAPTRECLRTEQLSLVMI